MSTHVKPRFIFLYGVICVGVPLALAANALALWMRDDLYLVLSVQNGFELAYTLMLVAPIVGMIAGNALWTWRTRSEPSRDDVAPERVDAAVELRIDAEPQRLSRPVVVPYSSPSSRTRAWSGPSISVGKGPSPTRVT